MFFPLQRFHFLPPIRDSLTAIQGEYLRYAQHEPIRFVEREAIAIQASMWAEDSGAHPSQTGFFPVDGDWDPIAVYKKEGQNRSFENFGPFPILWSLCSTIPQLNFVGFFRLSSGTKVLPHTHLESNIIFHMNLFELGGPCEMGCGNEYQVLSNPGDSVCFDYSNEHWTKNLSPSTRVNLVVDFGVESKTDCQSNRI